MRTLLLCAGKGTRLGHQAANLPKPMMPIAGRPLIEYTIAWLADAGLQDIAINLHYLPDVIPGHFGDGSDFGVRLTYIREPALLGTAGSVRNCADWWADSDDLLVIYGDLLTDTALRPMLDFHRARRAMATLFVHRLAGANSLVGLDASGRITGFVERPDEAQRALHPYPWVNSGLQVVNRSILPYIPPGFSDLPRDIYTPIFATEPLYGYPLTGCRVTIDTPELYEEACQAVATGAYRLPAALRPPR